MGSDIKIEEVSKPIVFFDGVCNLCNGAVQFIIQHDVEAKFMLAPLQSNLAKEFLGNKMQLDSIVLYQDGETLDKSSAALKIASQLDFPWYLLKVMYIFPRFFRDWVYTIIAKNRYRWFGKSDSCMIPSPKVMDRFLVID